MNKNKFYTSTDELIYNRHENHKTYLAEKKKEAKVRIEKMTVLAEKQREKIKKLESKLCEILDARGLYQKDELSVDAEYSYRKKIVYLQKKYDFLHVLWDGDDDVYTTWVYSDDFDGDENYVGDPFQDQHFHDSYEEAYNACHEYIDYHNEKGGLDE